MPEARNAKRILITGGSGFIGTNLIEFLVDKRCEVCNLDAAPPLNKRHQGYWHACDILDLPALTQSFSAFMPTHVVHLAARTDLHESDSLEGYAVNIVGTGNVLAASRDTGSAKRVVVASSMLVCRLGYVPVSDTDYAPPNLYGQSKVLTEQITRSFEMEASWTIIRPTTIWGPWSIRYRDEFLATLRKGLYIHPGSGRIMKTYGYVGNAVHQIHSILNAPVEQVHGKTFYLADPPVDLREWVDAFSLKLRGRKVTAVPLWILRLAAVAGDILSRVGIRSPLTTFRLRNMTNDNVLDVGPIMAIAGAGPHTIADGVAETVRWLELCKTDICP